MEFLIGLAVFLLGLGMFTLIASPQTGRAMDIFAAGFLPYRGGLEWPQGVQEEDPVPWSWSAPGAPNANRLGSGAGPEGPEVIEIGRDRAPAARAVLRRSMGPGMARRRA
jgi:hypothetical protein